MTVLITLSVKGEPYEVTTAPSAPLTFPTLENNPFDKNQWTVDFATAFTQPTFLDRHRFVTGTLGLGYAPVDRLMISLELSGDYMAEPGSTGCGGGFNLRGRVELLRIHNMSLFVDGLAGILESDHPVPFDGTHFNFIETAGVGVLLPIAPSVFIEGGGRYEHISNAGISVNPGYNGVQFYLGVMIPL
jgi:hypothetical protein